jgi:carboxymethylenebutenolidase
MRRIIQCLLLVAVVAIMAGCVTDDAGNTTAPGGADGPGSDNASAPVNGNRVNVTSAGQSYPAYVAAPTSGGPYPGIVLLHSFNGLEQGYVDMIDRLAGEGYVVIAPEWQTFNRTPEDAVVEGLIVSSIDLLRNRSDVNSDRLGLTGFCAGGRYTMLFLPQIDEFASGVAWYGFPYQGGFNNETLPADLVDRLEAPMLIIHGTRDQASNITGIYRYAEALDAADNYFELKVYQGEPHGFMVQNGILSETDVADDAYREMVDFFGRTLV